MAPRGTRPVRVIEIVNPFRADARRTELLLEPRPRETLLECVERAGLRGAEYVFRLNGELVPEGEEAFHTAMPGAEIVCAWAAGGGALKIVAQIGLLAATAALTGGLGDVVEGVLWSVTGITTAATAGIAAAALSIGGGLLISATLGGAGGGTKSAGVTYDPDGPKTLAQPGTPIPKGYGSFGWGGNIISSFVDQDGQDEYLNILVSFGFGPASAIRNILLNGKPVGSYPDLAYSMRMGNNNQTPIPGFDRIVNTYSQQVELLAANGPTIAAGQGLTTTGLQVAVKFPGGLMRTDSSGNPKEVSLAYRVEISPGGQNRWTTPIFPRTTQDVYTIDLNGFRHYPAWVVLPTDRYAGSGIVYSTDSSPGAHYPGEPWSMTQGVKVYNIDNSNYTYSQLFQGEWQRTDGIMLDLQSVTDWWGGYRIVSNMTNQSFYDIVNIYGLVAGKWDVRVAKYGAGPHNQPIPQGDGYMTDPHYTADAWLWDVSELQFSDLAYPNIVLLGIRALATSQISGANITVNATVVHALGEDTSVPAALSAFEPDNPALVAYDILANGLYGMSATNAALTVDVPAFARWAAFCDESAPNADGTSSRRFVFAGIFDESGTNAWGCLNKVATMARAQIVPIGNTFTVWIDAPTDTTQVFTEANILRGSYSETFLDYDSRAACIEAEFADAARSFRTDLPVSVMTAATTNSGQQPKITRTNLLGCTSRDQAWRWAYFHLVSTETLLKTANWKCGVEALSCQIGSVVGVQQRQWALGGRVQYGSTAALLVVDRTDLPAFSAGGGWTVGVAHPIVLRGSAKLASVAQIGGGQVLLTFAAVPAGRIMRCVNQVGAELAVVAGGGSAISGSTQGAFGVGDTVSFYDYDVIDIVPASAAASGTITPATPFLQPPTPDAPWFYGQSGGQAPYKLFRITSVRQSGDMQIELSALEYNPAIYADVPPVYGAVFAAPSVVAAVTGLTLAEKLQNAIGGSTTSPTQATIAVSWQPGPNTGGADVWGQVDGGAWNKLAHVTGSGYSFLATTGDVWSVKVVGCDRLGVPSSYLDAPLSTITVQGTGAAPGDVIGFLGSGSPTTLTWSTPAGGAAATSYEIRTGPPGIGWNSAALVALNVTGLSYTDSVARPGVYLIKALSAASVESINATVLMQVSLSSGVQGMLGVAQGGTGAGSPTQALAALGGASLGANQFSGQQTFPAAGLVIPDSANGHTYQVQITNGAVTLKQIS